MLIGLLVLICPIIVFLISLPFSRWFKPKLRKTYRVVGGILVFLGSGTSFYFAMYTGDQGGIAAYFFQLTVIAVYLVFSAIVVLLNWSLLLRDSGKQDR